MKQFIVPACLLIPFLLTVPAPGAASTLAPAAPECDALDAFAAVFAPAGYDLDHVATVSRGMVDATNRVAWGDSIYRNSAFLDRVPAGTYAVADFIKNRPDVDMVVYRAWLETLLMDGDNVCELTWTLHGTAAGDTTFSTFGFARGGVAVFEPLLYFHAQTVLTHSADKEGAQDSGSVTNGFGMETATWTIDVAVKCNNCRIIDPPPYTTVTKSAIFLWDVKYEVIEAKYFEAAPCCPDDKVECLKSVVKIAVTSGGKTSVTIKHDDWIEVKFEGWFGCTLEVPYTFHVCCAKTTTTKTTSQTGVPKRTFTPGEPVCVAGDNLPPNSVVRISVFPNLPSMHEGLPLPPPHPGTAGWLFTDGDGQVAGTDLGGSPPRLMPGYIPWPEGPQYDVGYDYVVDVNENGIWDPMEPALDVGEHPGFSSQEMSAVPPAVVAITLRGNPNPFNPTTIIEYDIGLPGGLVIDIHDLRGRLVRVLFAGEATAAAGSLPWDGTDNGGRRVGSGVYVVRARAHGLEEAAKLAVIK
jgi:hypothetical protein